jgi:hypothetical protein
MAPLSATAVATLLPFPTHILALARVLVSFPLKVVQLAELNTPRFVPDAVGRFRIIFAPVELILKSVPVDPVMINKSPASEFTVDTPDVPLETISIPPAVLLMVIPDPGVRVPRENPVPLPINN